MKVLIVGGGIAGCACAALLRKYAIADVTLVERAPGFHNIGLLLGVMGNGHNVLKELGIDEELMKKKAYPLREETIRNASGKMIKLLPVPSIEEIGPTITMHRADLHSGLIRVLRDTAIKFNTTVTKITQIEKRCHVTFDDGQQEMYDLIIAADGIRSRIRDVVFGTGFLKYYGWRTWYYWLPRSFKSSGQAEAYVGDGRLCIFVAHYDSTVAWIMARAVPGTRREGTCRMEAAGYFKDFASKVRDVIGLMPPDSEMFSDDHAYIEGVPWYKGRIVLVGDAQHAVSPVLGMGASMALEDASVLADELKRHGTIDSALRAFAERRTERLRHFTVVVQRLEKWMMAHGFLGHTRDLILPYMPSAYFSRRLSQFINTRP